MARKNFKSGVHIIPLFNDSGEVLVDAKEYDDMVRRMGDKGASTSDAQGAADAYFISRHHHSMIPADCLAIIKDLAPANVIIKERVGHRIFTVKKGDVALLFSFAKRFNTRNSRGEVSKGREYVCTVWNLKKHHSTEIDFVANVTNSAIEYPDIPPKRHIAREFED